MSRIILETERLSLREITADDLDDLLEIWGDPEAMRLFPCTLDRQAMREWIERNQKRYEQYDHGLWAIILRSEQRLIGDCGLVIQDVGGIEELEVGHVGWPSATDCASRRKFSGAAISIAYMLLNEDKKICGIG